MSIPLSWWLTVSAALFSIGMYGALSRKNAIGILMGIELILNAVNINLVAFWRYIAPNDVSGQIFAIIVITVAAAAVQADQFADRNIRIEHVGTGVVCATDGIRVVVDTVGCQHACVTAAAGGLVKRPGVATTRSQRLAGGILQHRLAVLQGDSGIVEAGVAVLQTGTGTPFQRGALDHVGNRAGIIAAAGGAHTIRQRRRAASDGRTEKGDVSDQRAPFRLARR